MSNLRVISLLLILALFEVILTNGNDACVPKKMLWFTSIGGTGGHLYQVCEAMHGQEAIDERMNISHAAMPTACT